MPFMFENLKIYQESLDWVESAESLITNLKGKASWSILDQLSRASMSIPLNIAEGNGRWHKADRRQFFWIARGSTFECVPIIQILKKRNLISEETEKQLLSKLEVIAKMITNLIKSVENLNR